MEMVHGDYPHVSRRHLTRPIGLSYVMYQKLPTDYTPDALKIQIIFSLHLIVACIQI